MSGLTPILVNNSAYTTPMTSPALSPVYYSGPNTPHEGNEPTPHTFYPPVNLGNPSARTPNVNNQNEILTPVPGQGGNRKYRNKSMNKNSYKLKTSKKHHKKHHKKHSVKSKPKRKTNKKRKGSIRRNRKHKTNKRH